MTNWVSRSTDVYLSLIYDRLHELIYDSKVIHVDESPVLVMQIDHTKIKNGKKTYMWVYRNRPVRGPSHRLFDWQPSRHSDYPREFQKTFCRIHKVCRSGHCQRIDCLGSIPYDHRNHAHRQ